MEKSELLSSLLSDREFYVFLEDLEYHASEIKKLDAMDMLEREKNIRALICPDTVNGAYSKIYMSSSSRSSKSVV